MLQDNKELLAEINNEINTAESLLSRGNEQQQIADELLADVDTARNRAEQAVKLGDKTLQEAEQTHKTLQGRPTQQ